VIDQAIQMLFDIRIQRPGNNILPQVEESEITDSANNLNGIIGL